MDKTHLNAASSYLAETHTREATNVESHGYQVLTDVISDQEAIASGMVRCSRCSQENCLTNTIKNNPLLRWCGRYSAGTKRGRYD